MADATLVSASGSPAHLSLALDHFAMAEVVVRPYPRPNPWAYQSASVWLYRVARSTALLGEAHDATQAALGRYWALSTLGAVPQRNAKSPAAISWHRASESQPGYYNRRYRRYEKERAAQAS